MTNDSQRSHAHQGESLESGDRQVASARDALRESDDETLSVLPAPPHTVGEHTVSGSSPDPVSDDDTLRNSHEVGLRLDEDYEHPKELNIAADVAAAERRRRSMDTDDMLPQED